MPLTPEERQRIREEEEEREAVRAEIAKEKQKRRDMIAAREQISAVVLAVVFGGIGFAAVGPLGITIGMGVVLIMAVLSRPRG